MTTKYTCYFHRINFILFTSYLQVLHDVRYPQCLQAEATPPKNILELVKPPQQMAFVHCKRSITNLKSNLVWLNIDILSVHYSSPSIC